MSKESKPESGKKNLYEREEFFLVASSTRIYTRACMRRKEKRVKVLNKDDRDS